MAQMNPGMLGANSFQQPGQDQAKMFQAEAENLEVTEYWSIYDGVDSRLLQITR